MRPCAARSRRPRMHQRREGWHLPHGRELTHEGVAAGALQGSAGEHLVGAAMRVTFRAPVDAPAGELPGPSNGGSGGPDEGSSLSDPRTG
jgi:hypothetical protein